MGDLVRDSQNYYNFLQASLAQSATEQNFGQAIQSEVEQITTGATEQNAMSQEMGTEILISSLPAVFPNAIDVYQKAQNIYQNVKDIGAQFGKVTEAVSSIPNDVRALYGNKVNQIEALVKQGGADSLAKAKSLYGDLQQTVQKAATTGKSIVTSSANQMTDLANTAKGSIGKATAGVSDIIANVKGDLSKISPDSIINAVSSSYTSPSQLFSKEGLMSNALNIKETAKASLKKLSDETDKQISGLKTKLETATDSEKITINNSIQDLKDNYNKIGDSIKSKLAEVKQTTNDRYKEIQNKAAQVTEPVTEPTRAPEPTRVSETQPTTIEKQIEEHTKIDPMKLDTIDERLDWHEKLDDLNETLARSKATEPTPAPAPEPVIETPPARIQATEPAPAPVRQVFPAYDEDGIQPAPRGVSYENPRPATTERRPFEFTGEAIGERPPITRAEKEAQRQAQINADRDEAIRISNEPVPSRPTVSRPQVPTEISDAPITKTIVSRTNVSRTATENIGRSQNLTEISEEFPLRQQLMESSASKDLNIFSETGIKQTASNIFKSSGADNPFSQLGKEAETLGRRETAPYLTNPASETIIGRAKTAVSKIPTITEETTSMLPEVSSSLLSKLGSGIGGIMEVGGVAGGIAGSIQEAKGGLQSTAQKIQTGLGQEQALEIVSQRGAQVVQAGKQALAGGEQLASKAGSQLQAQGQNVMTAGKEAFGQTEQVVSKAATELQAQGTQLASKTQSTIEASRGAVSDLVENVGAKSSDLLASVAEKGALETLGEITGISAIPVVGEVAALGGLIYGAISGIEDLFSHTSSKPAQPLPQAPVIAGIVHQAGL